MLNEKCFGKMKINAKEKKIKFCNFCNIASMSLKITHEGVLILFDFKTVSCFPVIVYLLKEMRFSTLSWSFFAYFVLII